MPSRVMRCRLRSDSGAEGRTTNGRALPADGTQWRPADGGQWLPTDGGQWLPTDGGQWLPTGSARPLVVRPAAPALGGRPEPAIFSLWVALVVALLLMPALALAQAVSDPTPLQYRDAAEEARFHSLAAELRCVQCQNQSLADSNAQIAHDLRREVLTLMQQGNSDAQIKQFLVERYGEFVLYRPTMDTRNSLLWFGPLVLVLGGAGVLVWVVRRRSRQMQPMGDSEERW